MGLDTNVLVRYLAADDPGQYRAAAALIETDTDDSFFVSDVVICELIWVLREAYKASRADTVEILVDLLETPVLAFTDRERLYRSLAKYASGRGDFADYLIGLQAIDAGYDATYTFDKALHSDPGFTPVRDRRGRPGRGRSRR